MKANSKKRTRKTKNALRLLPRSLARNSAFAFVACLGIWLPRAQAAVLVNLDATQLAEGALSTWPNSGTVAGDFTATTTLPNLPAVVTLDEDVRGVQFVDDDTDSLVGPGSPIEVTGAGPRSIEAWVFNPDPDGQGFETVVAWGRRGQEFGNNSFGHGTNGTWGAFGGWGAADLDWAGNIAFGRWTYIAYTYDGTTQSVYFDGELANSEDIALATFAADTDLGNPLPFRVGAQNLDVGTPWHGVDTERPSLAIARIRIHDTALTAGEINAQFVDEASTFLPDTDDDGLPNWYENQYDFLDPNNPDDAAEDFDDDSLSNLGEFENETDPENPDSDGDGVTDGDEVNRMVEGSPAPTNPLSADTDGDGLSDGVETNTGEFVDAQDTGTDPLLADTDEDGFGDFQEVIAGSDPTDPSSNPGGETPPLVSLDATTFDEGPLEVWPNLGALGGDFVAPETGIAAVETIAAVKGVTLDGTDNYYTGPAAPAFITGDASRTVEGWVFNPAAAAEETIFAWGRRNGPEGSNASYIHGTNPTFGAAGHWGAEHDVGWGGGEGLPVVGQWTHYAFTYDNTTLVARVYSNGVEVNMEEWTTPLITHAVDTGGQPLPFRVGSQNDDSGAPTGGLRGSMSIARLRVYDRALDATTIQSQFDDEAGEFGLIDFDGDGLPTWFERQYSFLDENDPSDAGEDQDSDDLTNLEEYNLGTNLEVADTDGDGLTDGEEVNATLPTNPLTPDTDQDGVPDGAETGTGTFVDNDDTGSDPTLEDSDGDGFPDGVEVAYGSNPNDNSSIPDRSAPVALVELDAGALSGGTLDTWPNTGAVGGSFTALPESSPSVESIMGIQGVSFDGSNQNLTGPVVPTFLNGDASRSVDAWIFNPDAAAEEPIIAWGRRSEPPGSNSSFNHGTSEAFGAFSLWGDPDMGWGDVTNVVTGEWTHVAFTYTNVDPFETTAYTNGVEAHAEVTPFELAAQDVDTAGLPLRFRVAAQNAANGNASAPFGSMTIARIRVYDQALTAQQVSDIYEAESDQFVGVPDLIISDFTYDAAAGSVTLTWTVAPGSTYAVQASGTLGDTADFQNIATGLDTGTFTEDVTEETRFYRLQLE